MKITFGKVKIREFDDTPSCPVIVNDVRVGDLKRGYIEPNEFSDWYMDSSSLGMIIPEHESAGWSKIADAKRDVSKWIKKIPPKKIAERLVKGNWWSKSDREYKTMIKSNTVKLESKFTKARYRGKTDAYKFIRMLQKYEYDENQNEWDDASGMRVELKFEAPEDTNEFEKQFLHDCLELDKWIMEVKRKGGSDDRFGLSTVVTFRKNVESYLDSVYRADQGNSVRVKKLNVELDFSLHVVWMAGKVFNKNGFKLMKDRMLDCVNSLVGLMEEHLDS